MYRGNRVRAAEFETSGHDSFLDVVTNIIGILIVLVMVVGMQAKHEVPEPVKGEQEQKLAALRSESVSVEDEVRRMEQENDRLDRELLLRSREREILATRIVDGEQELNAKRLQLDSAAQAQWSLQNSVASAQGELNRLKQLAEAVALGAQETTVTIDSYPTPLGKTVFGKEAHFQLARDRIAYVPFEELLDRAKSDMQRHKFSPDDLPERTFEVGPMDGYQLLLTMGGQVTANSNQVMFTLREAEFVPVSSGLGEAFSEAFAPRSDFQSRLAGYNPKDTTITVWFYPDSFENFRTLKKELHTLGYATAGWPLPEGTYISGSPKGKRSATQ